MSTTKVLTFDTPHSCGRNQLQASARSAIQALWDREETQTGEITIHHHGDDALLMTVTPEGGGDVTQLEVHSNQFLVLRLISIFFGQYNQVFMSSVAQAPRVNEERLALLRAATTNEQRQWFMARQAKRDTLRNAHFDAALFD